MAVCLEFNRPPSALLFMMRAFAPSPGLKSGVPDMSATWRDIRVDARQLATFCELTGLNTAGELSILYPHVVGFRLIMAVLTHPAYPLPIWNALQIRNRLTQFRPMPVDAVMTMRTDVGAGRVLPRGVEIDLTTTLRIEDALCWESVNTFYYRGKFGASERPAADFPAPRIGGTQVSEWRAKPGVGPRFAALTGDYNGVHLSNAYARLFGFPRAFHHPQLVIGQCLARLTPPRAPQRLETWIKGPVPYGVGVRLNAATENGATVFGLFVENDTRPAIVGRWSSFTPTPETSAPS